MAKQELDFYSLKAKKKFRTKNYKTVKKGNRLFAVAQYEGGDCWRAIKKEE